MRQLSLRGAGSENGQYVETWPGPVGETPLIPAIVQTAPHRFPLCCAPSTMMHAPVTQLARSDAKKATTSATSSGVPIRSQGSS